MVMNHMSVQLSRQFPVDPLTCHKLTLNVCNNFLAMDLLGRAARPADRELLTCMSRLGFGANGSPMAWFRC